MYKKKKWGMYKKILNRDMYFWTRNSITTQLQMAACRCIWMCRMAKGCHFCPLRIIQCMTRNIFFLVLKSIFHWGADEQAHMLGLYIICHCISFSVSKCCFACAFVMYVTHQCANGRNVRLFFSNEGLALAVKLQTLVYDTWRRTLLKSKSRLEPKEEE